MPPGRFLTSVRIEAAKLLLAEREYSLEMIAGCAVFPVPTTCAACLSGKRV